MFLWKEGFLHYLQLYPGLGVSKTICCIWAIFCKIIQVFGFLLPFPSPHFRIIIVLKLYFHIQLLRDSYCAAISSHISFVRKTIAASGQSSERISIVYGTALTLTRQCCFLSCGVEPWNDEWQAGGMCRFVTDSYRGPSILLNWSLIYKLIAFVSCLTVVQTQWFRHFFILANS